jgi:hypothetical protein
MRIYTSGFRMHFPQCIAIFLLLTLIDQNQGKL